MQSPPDSVLTQSLWTLYADETQLTRDTHQTRTVKLALREAWLTAIQRWPNFAPYKEQFVARIAQSVENNAEESTAISLLRAEDLLLATAALAGCSEAQANLEGLIRETIRPALLKYLRSDEPLVEEVAQCTVVDVLYGRQAGRRAKLATYSGGGRLTGWLTTVAKHTANDHLKQRGRMPGHELNELDAHAAPPLPDDDQDTAPYLRDYGKQLMSAIKRAIEDLPAKPRTLLKMSLVEGMSIDEIGRFYGVHRATAAKWIKEAKLLIVDQSQQAFCGQTGAATTDFKSIVRVLVGYVDVSIERMLRDDDASSGTDSVDATS
jgi:RNA polymerase sigma-70 factor (ECF subfamily)